jgi:hypothetical protein
MKITLDNINKFGFVFHVYDHKNILKDSDEETIFSLETYIDSLIKVPGQKLYSDIDIVEPGGSIDLHFHTIPGSFQVVVWRPEESFLGREYVYGTPKLLQYAKPFKGLMCFMKPNDPNFVHGVTKLLSDKPIKSYGFSSSICELPEKNDIYISLDQT